MRAVALSCLLALPAFAETPCTRSPDGRVSCTADGFDKLVDKCVGFQTDRDQCRLDLADARKAIDASKASLDLCLATPPKPRPLQSIGGFALGVVGTALALVPFAIPGADQTLRLSLAAAGAAVAGTGLVFAIPLE